MRRDEDRPRTDRPNDNEALQNARERAREVRRQFVREWNQTTTVSDQTKIKAAEVAVDYRDILIDYREEVSTPAWDERELDWVVDLVGEEVIRETERPGLGRGTEADPQPAFVDVNPVRLYQLLKKFDQIWRELGFGAETEQNNPLYKVPDGSEVGNESA